MSLKPILIDRTVLRTTGISAMTLAAGCAGLAATLLFESTQDDSEVDEDFDAHVDEALEIVNSDSEDQ